MFDIKLKFEDLEILSIEKEDLGRIYKWFTKEEKYLLKVQSASLDEKQFYERFLEYYLSECEFFLKINRGSEFIGIIKGTIDFKNPNEVWIGYIMVEHSLRGRGVGAKVLKEIIRYFCIECGICNFFVKVNEKNLRFISFLRKNKFKVSRVCKETNTALNNGFIILTKIIQ
ncbi:GNAT family N-acetyltransferase [Clostridium ganghwense]|uniref:GNAT family N-acetyltransferase n=1 Tax=Clostridium ganghwense TaxID=312089 RepID=A0ABT4CRP8_9CLOT|nr:GNAT family N-acetyltransferase [Clostridium ganghwense]MCY6370756.1 GNAT family N-acetyltransferase [Clostridium ganghwense]